MRRRNSDRLTLCTTCKHTGETCQAGYELIARLRAAISAAGDCIAEDFEISGTASMTGCERLCTVGYHASRTASYMFGDIDPEEDIEELLAFAQAQPKSDALGCDLGQGPETGSHTELARLPSAIMALEQTSERLM